MYTLCSVSYNADRRNSYQTPCHRFLQILQHRLHLAEGRQIVVPLLLLQKLVFQVLEALNTKESFK